MQKAMLEHLEAVAQFLLKLYGPLLLCSAIIGGLFVFFVATNTVPIVGWLAIPLQICSYWLADLFVTHRKSRCLISTVTGQRPDDVVHESIIWLSIFAASCVLTLVCFSCPEPFIVPALVIAIPHLIALSLFAWDCSAFVTFDERVFSPCLEHRKQVRAKRQKEADEQQVQREKQNKQHEKKQRKQREKHEAEQRNLPKPLQQQIDAILQTHDRLIEQLDSLDIAENKKSMAKESLNNHLSDLILKLTQDPDSLIG